MIKQQDWRFLALSLSLALVHGVVYVFLLPPWQHYDEPAHFENVWLWASTGRAPQNETPDLVFRQKLVQSMLANGFYRGATPPDFAQVQAGATVYGLEYSQLNEPPLYYGFVSLPVRFLQTHNPAVMLIAARLMSVSLFLLTIFCIWGITRELSAPGSPLRFWVPVSAALLPGFVDVMTAVNNDVGAIAAFTCFLWGSVYFLRHPKNIWVLGWVLGSVLLCLGMKSSAFIAAPLSLLVLLLGWFRGPTAKWIWGLGILGCLMGTYLSLTWDEPAYWARATSQLLPGRVQTETPLGDFALQIDPSAALTPDYLSPFQQLLPLPAQNQLLTLGVWMWTDAPGVPVEARTPMLRVDRQTFYETVSLTNIPTFYAFEVSLPPETSRIWLSLEPAPQNSQAIVYYDGLILAEGYFPLDTVPAFDTSQAETGIWGGNSFQNLIRNSSFEKSWPALRPSLDNQLAKVIPDHARLSTLLFGVFDVRQTSPYFSLTATHLFETFWARFAWGQVPLVIPAIYTLLKWMSLAGFIGMVLRWKSITKPQYILLLATMCVVWGATFLRGEIFLFTPTIFVPVARYAFPAIAPTLFCLWVGWLAWGDLINLFFRGRSIDLHRFAHIIALLCSLSLAGVSIYSILLFYQRI
ncbi:MAG TPA: hypothetical protein PK530_10585 [Anaerolineales bacterium]|nr:hypothetical protein [Anaerolineales bacterium]